MGYPDLKFNLKQVTESAKKLERLLDISSIDPAYSYKAWHGVDSIKLLVSVATETKAENIGVASIPYSKWQEFLQTNTGIKISFDPYIEVNALRQLEIIKVEPDVELFVCVQRNGKRYFINTLDNLLPVLLFEGDVFFYEFLNTINPDNLNWVHSSSSLISFTMRFASTCVSVNSNHDSGYFELMRLSLNAEIVGTRIIEI
jgi:hypothetical protein